ncbi:MAG: DNA mismatch repair protein MutS, partial [Lachnospiraceae bacterium]|nr:DNA mismatch repair protein MutS [Lachnospiraceae bacterium]
KKGSLLWVLDRTKTAMGARCLRSWIERPLLDRDRIEARLDAVEELLSHAVDREEIREYLRSVYDLERLLTKIAYLSANPRDIIALGASMRMLAPVRMILSGFGSSLLKELFDEIDPLEDLVGLIERSISEDAPVTVREGGIIREGYDADIDHLRLARTQGKEWLLSLEEEDRQRTGIRNLKIKYNKVFGYYFDVTNSYRDLVPPDYERKQTLVGSERYTTPRLRELEDSILNAQDKLNTLEYDAFCGVRDAIAAKTAVIQRSAKALAALDTLCSFAAAAEENRYVRPSFNDRDYIRISDGRHPVVEKMLSGDFIANDTYLDSKKDVIAIITGPNMAGKSTYMRQVALICLMAQTGCFVPASSADLCIVDRIFTRVGASDDLGSGQSTFMVEMNEVANILRNATPRSLLILDEIGRGTSTFDGLSIAWAVIEHISNKRYLGAKTLFATHYHELTELEGKIDNVKNYCVAVREKGDDIIFLRKIVAGGADHSYGIQVARLAGVPEIVTDRAMEIASQLTDNDITEKMAQIGPAAGAAEKKTAGKQHYDEVDLSQMSFLSTVSEDDIIRQIKEADIPSMTPMDALNLLYRLQNDLSNTWG